MKIANFEATGLEKVVSWIEQNNIMQIDELSLQQVLKNVNISFILEGINRVQSTLICELKDSYVQQSQRYVTLSSDAYGLPVLDESDSHRAVELTEKAFDLYSKMSQLKAEAFQGRPKPQHYLHGIPIEDARYILPLSTMTNVCVAMSGDKLIAFFRLLTDRRYSILMAEIKETLSLYLPKALLCVLPNEHSGETQNIVQEIYAADFSKISVDDTMVFLEGFTDLTLKVGLGALTSTSQEPPSSVMTKWGQKAEGKAQEVVKRVLGYGHESIAEQARTTFGMMCSMVTYHQQIRHRLSENCREELDVLIREQDRAVKVPQTIEGSVFHSEYVELVNKFKHFRTYIAQKYNYEYALYFLLNCDQIKLLISANARADISMLADRTCRNAQWEIRELALKKLKVLRKVSTVLYEKALPACVYGSCKEGVLSCGQQVKVREEFG